MPHEQRASDGERELAVSRLRDACAEGRLTPEELAERVEAAYVARTHAQLDALTADLPRGVALSLAPARRRLAIPGGRPFRERVTSPGGRAHVAEQVLTRLGPVLDACGYEVASSDPAAIVFERESRPGWTIAAAVFAFPIGLLALTYKTRARIVVSFAAAPGGGTEITIYGTAPLGLRRAFAELSE